MTERIVVALGGHALARAEAGTVRSAVGGLIPLLRAGHRMVITHGNGPQVGALLAHGAARLDVCVAQTQGEIGYLLQHALAEELSRDRIDRPVVTIVTEVLVEPSDPGFEHPTKPVGPALSPEEANRLRKSGVRVAEDPGRGWRRVVPSPRPKRILQAEVVRRLSDEGAVVIAGGGGGIPVVRREGGVMEGVEAVIDKDLTAAELALELGADRILNLTSVDAVRLNFLRAGERILESLTLREARRYLDEGQFAPGSMGPKIEGAIRFLEQRGRGEVIVTTPENLARGRAGTRIHLEPKPRPGTPEARVSPEEP